MRIINQDNWREPFIKSFRDAENITRTFIEPERINLYLLRVAPNLLKTAPKAPQNILSKAIYVNATPTFVLAEQGTTAIEKNKHIVVEENPGADHKPAQAKDRAPPAFFSFAFFAFLRNLFGFDYPQSTT